MQGFGEAEDHNQELLLIPNCELLLLHGGGIAKMRTHQATNVLPKPGLSNICCSLQSTEIGGRKRREEKKHFLSELNKQTQTKKLAASFRCKK